MNIEKGRTIEADNYVGMKTKTASAKIQVMTYGPVIKLESEPLPLKAGDSMPEDKPLVASKIFGLKIGDDGRPAIIENSKFHKFLLNKRINIEGTYEIGQEIEELKGIPVVVQKNAENFLELA